MSHPPTILITAGPTHEAIDPVRYLANRSSGKMGFALAAAAAARGWNVILISGPVALTTPPGVTRVDVESAAEMFAAVRHHCPQADMAILAAAVADFTPLQCADQKIKKSGPGTITLTLEQTKDILGSMRHEFAFHGKLIGFAAETENLLDNAQQKLIRKGCDMLVANDVSRSDIGFASANNQVSLLFRDGRPTLHLPFMPKSELAKHILAQCAGL